KAWDQFCAAERLDPGVCETVAPGNATLEVADDEATAHGFTDTEALDYVQRSGDKGHALKTAQSVAGELSAALQFIANKL
ncbi:hypothetical protein R5W23_005390, partial [Gemmata sp. JC673]